DERPAGKVLLVAWLLADQHQRRIRWPFAKHGLGRILVQWTARAAHRLFGELLQRALGIIDALRLREQRQLRITQVLSHRSHLGEEVLGREHCLARWRSTFSAEVIPGYLTHGRISLFFLCLQARSTLPIWSWC